MNAGGKPRGIISRIRRLENISGAEIIT